MLSPEGIPSMMAFGVPLQEFIVQEYLYRVSSVGIPTEEASGKPTVTYVPATIQLAAGIPSAEAFGTPSQSIVLTR